MPAESAYSPVGVGISVLQEALISIYAGTNINVTSPGNPVRYDSIIRSTIVGLFLTGGTPPTLPDMGFPDPGLYLIAYNILYRPNASDNSRYVMRFDLSIGGVIQTVPRFNGSVWDPNSTNPHGDTFVTTIEIVVPNTLVRLWSFRTAAATGPVYTEPGGSVSVVRLS